ncbi:hypothetical protein CGCVW01_v011717 [Colletotrichum viniferum]|nr:hypothetical protein CGCVW01_v011717 [Colletotrichum viniferum]
MEGKYIYAPVPMNDEVEFRIPLEHLILPGPHSDKFWITTVPTKLKPQLHRYPGEDMPVIGWGVKVNEGLNWSHLLRLVLVVMFLIARRVCCSLRGAQVGCFVRFWIRRISDSSIRRLHSISILLMEGRYRVEIS